jgi:WD40 repeat protein
MILSSVAFSGTGTTILGGDESGRVQASRFNMIPLRPGTSPGTMPFYFSSLMDQIIKPQGSEKTAKIRATTTSQDGQTLIAALNTNMVLVWRTLRLPGTQIGGHSVISQKPIFLRVPLPVFAMALDPSGRWLATLDTNGVSIWDLKTLPRIQVDEKPIDPDGPGLIHNIAGVRELAFHPAGDRLALAVETRKNPTAPPEYAVRVIDFKGKVLAEMKGAHTADIEAIAFGGKAGDQLATADAGGIIRVWKVEPNELKPQATLAGHTGPVQTVAFSQDGRTLASGGADRAVVLWDPVTGQERAVLTGHMDLVMRVQFLPDSTALLTVSRDGSVKRWRAIGQSHAVNQAPNMPRSVIAPMVPGRD